ncbi:MAG: hypothetical protein IIB69_09600 [Proteobacteria bacterium]|nr:hypothetical protein [Pseudomonadota bacterium]MCH8177195.1 hypothetical protein [Pseudomonadota bacterium]
MTGPPWIPKALAMLAAQAQVSHELLVPIDSQAWINLRLRVRNFLISLNLET